jgi:ATPase subunit of ABC transporter with duplicated ATPase domains
MSSLVSVHGLSFAFPDGRTKLFDGFSFHIGKEKVGLVGKNGLGKTTLKYLVCQKNSMHCRTLHQGPQI